MGKIKNPSRWMSKGFSIIEVISAIIILSIMATLSVNMMSSYKLRQNISSARQQLMNAMTNAAASALRDNIPYVVIFDSTKHNVRACPAAACKSTSESDDAFNHDLTMFSQPVLFAGGGSSAISLGDVGSSYFIKFTPFGKILVSDSLESTKQGEYFRLFLKDKKGDLISKNELCLGVQFSINGNIESLETGLIEGNCR